MFVVHVIPHLRTGGAEQSLVRLVHVHRVAHPDDRVEVWTVAGERVERLRSELVSAGVAVRSLSGSGRRFPWAGLCALWQLYRRCGRARPDVLHAWMYHCALLSCVTRLRRRRPRVVWGIRTARDPRAQKWHTAVSARLCAVLSSRIPTDVVYCARSAMEIHERYGFDPGRSLLIPNGMPVMADYGSEPKGPEFVIGYLARFHPAKGHEDLFNAVARLSDSGVRPILVLAGRGIETNNAELVELTRQHGLQGRVMLLGELPERQLSGDFFAQIHVYCSPSLAEGFPNGVAEAMAHGVPVIATDVGDTKELVGACGEVVAAGQPKALADRLRCVAHSPNDERRRMGLCGQERVQTHYSIAAMLAGYMRVYERP